MSNFHRTPRQKAVQLLLALGPRPATEGVMAGAMGNKRGVQEALVEAIKRSALDREAICREVSRLTGAQVSIHQMNNWTGESRSDRHIPLEHLAALVAVLDAPELARAALFGSGLDLLGSEDQSLLELGRVLLRKNAGQRKSAE